MNWDQIEGNWKQYSRKARQEWGKLTEDDLDRVAGRREGLIGQIEKRYGVTHDEAERQVQEWQLAGDPTTRP